MKNKDEAFELFTKENIPLFPIHGILENGDCTCKLGGNCLQKGNHPFFENWSKMITTNINLCREWLPCLNYGIPTGTISKIVVVEVDRTNDGSNSIGRLQHKLGLISTLRVNSDRDHFDLYYRYDDIFKLEVKLKNWKGIRVKAENDWVLGPYSQVSLNKFKIPDLGLNSGVLEFKSFSELYPTSNEIYSLTDWREACI